MTEAAIERPLVGTVLGDRYELRSRLGMGGMGVVYAAFDRELEEEIALKLLRADAPPDAVRRLRREVRLARRVTHANVARTFDLAVAGPRRFITMELVRGEPLSRRLEGGARLALADALRIAVEIARGLVAAHAAGVVHRDLKPSNVMIGSMRAVITDFGIAWSAPDDGGAGPPSSHAGTPAYMAPEQLFAGEVDGRTDVYAFGVMLFRMLTGVMPFASDAGADVGARLLVPAPDPRAIAPTLFAPVAALVRATLESDRRARMDAAELLRRLEAVRAGVVSADAALDVAAPPAPADSDAVRDGVPDAPRETTRTIPEAPSSRGPADPAVRELYDEAMLQHHLAPNGVANRRELLERAFALAPDDPWVLSALSAALVRSWNYSPRGQRTILSRAEDLALRGLAIDPLNGQTFQTVGFLRLVYGETRAAVRAFGAALARDPSLPDANHQLALIAAECGDFAGAHAHFDRALECGAPEWQVGLERARVLALAGDRAAAERALATSLASAPSAPSALYQSRLGMWWHDERAVAEARARVKTVLAAGDEGPHRALVGIGALFCGASLPASPADIVARIDASEHLPRMRAWMFQLVAELWAGSDDPDVAVAVVARSVDAGLTDVAWFDHCPALELLRRRDEVVQLRTIVGARASAAWPP